MHHNVDATMNLKTSTIIKATYLIVSLLLIALLVHEYSDYNLRVYSIKRLHVEVEDVCIYANNSVLFLNLTYSLSNNGVKSLEVSMITYKIYFGSEVARTYSENFYGSPLTMKPLQRLLRSIVLKVPEFKLRRNTVNGTVRVYVLFNVYIKTRFGNTPVTYRGAVTLSVSGL